MEDSGEILRQISSFKGMVDKVNEEIEQTIQDTRQVDSEIAKYSEMEMSYRMKESELTKMVSIGEFELNDLIPVAAAGKNYLEALDRDLDTVKQNMDESRERILVKREKFIVLCDHFQNDIQNVENDELTKLLLEKETLENEDHNLNARINALQTSTEEVLEEILEEIHSSTAGLEAEIQRRTSEKMELLKDIDELKVLLCSISLPEDSSLLTDIRYRKIFRQKKGAGQTSQGIFLEPKAIEQMQSLTVANHSL